jgi:threonine/homoserine/homoserine lactone efflux protein
MMNSIAAFAVMSVILTVTPGPDSLLVLRSSLQGGRRAGTRVAGGAALGSLAWGICSAAGLTAVLAASAQAFRAVQLIGAAYLVFLGIRGWRARAAHDGARAEGDAARPQRTAGFRAGLFSNLLNPKVGVFFLAVMPQFIPHGAPVAGFTLAFAATDMVIASAWLLVVAWISDRARSLLRRPRVRTGLDRAAGTTLVALGIKVAASQLA